MHVYFSGIGGTAIGPLALIANEAGYEVSGSDKQNSEYIKYLKTRGIKNITIGQTEESIQSVHASKPIDWLVYSSAVSIENPNHPELVFAKENNIKATKRDDFLNTLIDKSNLKLIAVAGTHGKTTTTAMLIWLFKQLNIPVSYSVGAKLPFGDMGEFDPDSKYFIYEADEYDHNFLSFTPYMSLITGIGYDHPDIYPTKEDYMNSFKEFIGKSTQTIAHQSDIDKLSIDTEQTVFFTDDAIAKKINLVGRVNRENATLVIKTLAKIFEIDSSELFKFINRFPGLSRRFEKIADNLYSDYAHTPEKILGAIQTAKELNKNIAVVYEGLHNTRQHFIKSELATLFDGAKSLYVVPSYLAREDESLEMLTPAKLCEIIQKPEKRIASKLDDQLKTAVSKHLDSGDLVLCLSAGGGGSLDEWLRVEFKN